MAHADFVPAPGSPFDSGSNATSIALGDVNGDGRLDAVGTANGAVKFLTLLGDGAGRLTGAPGTADAGSLTNGVSTGDLNGDGRADAGLVNSDMASSGRALLGTPSGAPALAPGSPFVTANTPVSTAIGDVTGDGRADLVASRVGGGGSDTNTVIVHPGNGDGSFGLPVQHEAGNASLRRIRLGDVDGNGSLDVVVAWNAALFSVLRNTGGGTFAAPQLTVLAPSSGAMNELALGDLNGDGRLDVAAVRSATPPEVHTLLGAGDGTFTPAPGSPRTIPQFNAGGGDSIQTLSIGDMNADGRPDVVAAPFNSSAMAVLRGDGTGGLGAPTTHPAGPSTGLFADVGDMNGDLQPDIVALGRDLTQSVVLLNTDAASVAFDPAGLAFGERLVGLPAITRAVTVRNSGTGRLRTGTPSVTGDFAVVADGCAGRTLLVGETCALTIGFRPSGRGERSGVLTLPSNAPGAPAAIGLTGSGSVALAGDPRPRAEPRPRVLGATLTRTRFRVGPTFTATSAQRRRRTPRGTVLTVRTANATTVRVLVQRRTSGRRVGGRCVRTTRRNRARRPCSRFPTRMTLSRRVTAGRVRVAFSGRTRRARLTTGRHRFVVAAVRGRLSSAPRTLAFTVVRR